jgi:magnesium-transporting ATPase (P-type)
MNNDYIHNNKTQKDDNKKIRNIPFDSRIRQENIPQRRKEYLQGKKAISMKQIFDTKEQINININQNININTNLKENRKQKNSENQDESKPQSEEGKIKGMKMKSCIFNAESDHIKEKKAILSMNLNRAKSRELKDIDSCIKMEKLLEKQSQLETKNFKKEKILEFYINNNEKNKVYNLKNNTITTTKYSIITFIPKGLLYQFSRLSNVYFLFTAIIQSIPLISPLTSLTAIVPLIFVLGVSMIRELIEDLRRKNYDNISNEEEVIVLRNNRFVRAMSKSLKYGEIILVYENRSIPADMILIDSGFEEGTCYVETSSLDGEKTLKLKVANKYTQGFVSNNIKINRGIERFIHPGKYSFNGYIKINGPNPDLNYINGTIHTCFKQIGRQVEQDINISTNEFLLKAPF